MTEHQTRPWQVLALIAVSFALILAVASVPWLVSRAMDDYGTPALDALPPWGLVLVFGLMMASGVWALWHNWMCRNRW